MKKKQLFQLLISIGVLNAMTIIVGALTGENAYVIAEKLRPYFSLILCIVPLGLTSVSIIWWLIDIYLKTEQRINHIAIAFSGILADAVFIIGTILFSSGH